MDGLIQNSFPLYVYMNNIYPSLFSPKMVTEGIFRLTPKGTILRQSAGHDQNNHKLCQWHSTCLHLLAGDCNSWLYILVSQMVGCDAIWDHIIKSGAYKKLVNKGFWMHSHQNLIQNQAYNVPEVFLVVLTPLSLLPSTLIPGSPWVISPTS